MIEQRLLKVALTAPSALVDASHQGPWISLDESYHRLHWSALVPAIFYANSSKELCHVGADTLAILIMFQI